ncbi:flavodoxin-dependent (E)-4-hydroxy-3-methylbut-2-enyl-diphosphate synthase [Campylobacter sp. FMV-PI01]|uniref:4-hydroxy-3-methylbut-2-en-1-yl diphosphate synthase (flavodoxin) n=1 Tax=Campylobacter portucalensis TaxID=2608384 RepID=A0A6L5WKM3_9BACT|nr:flavodoxin-dependent (E)-4-hydroxy-3-methylbut-2-enyl-diphosphate synthase [Campylobacter portucalensis]MSN96962.1 flavodoxin-dependent (E)-4-hydroxy-3-methylbut-2-enyl-diphosphate synthase [Campylobacter portucalensis]
MHTHEIKRFNTKKLFVGNVAVGGDAKISVQSMTFSKTKDIDHTLSQINRLYFAGCDIVRCAVLSSEDARALEVIKKQSPLPIVADIHFNHKHALKVAPFIDAIRINPGNIGGKEKIKAVVDACKERNLPIRIGVNSGSLEKEFEEKYGRSVKGMIESAKYNFKLLEDFDFSDIAISLKSSDVLSTMEAYRGLRSECIYPFHLGVTEAGTSFHATIKSAMALGGLLLEGIGDTMRVSITGELEEEIKVARAILQDSGVQKSGINIISCPTCGRLQSDLVSAVKIVEEKTKHIKTPLNVSVMGCVVNALGEAKGADVAIAFGKGQGLVMRKGEVVAKLKEDKLVERFLEEVEDEVNSRNE